MANDNVVEAAELLGIPVPVLQALVEQWSELSSGDEDKLWPALGKLVAPMHPAYTRRPSSPDTPPNPEVEGEGQELITE